MERSHIIRTLGIVNPSHRHCASGSSSGILFNVKFHAQFLIPGVETQFVQSLFGTHTEDSESLIFHNPMVYNSVRVVAPTCCVHNTSHGDGKTVVDMEEDGDKEVVDGALASSL